MDGLDKIRYVMTTYKETINNLKPGESAKVECPFCHGKLTLSKSSYNGHLWITCENKCILVMQ